MEGAGPGWRLGRALWIKAGQTSNPASLLLGLLFMSWPFCPLRFLFVLTSFMFSFRPLFREGKSLLHRKSGGLRLITNTWLACWRITRTLLLANRNTLSLNRESQTHNQDLLEDVRSEDLPFCCWGLKQGAAWFVEQVQTQAYFSSNRPMHTQCDIPC